MNFVGNSCDKVADNIFNEKNKIEGLKKKIAFSRMWHAFMEKSEAY